MDIIRLILAIEKSNKKEKDAEVDQQVKRVGYVEEIVEIGGVVRF